MTQRGEGWEPRAVPRTLGGEGSSASFGLVLLRIFCSPSKGKKHSPSRLVLPIANKTLPLLPLHLTAPFSWSELFRSNKIKY